jgi:hypothetical protein
MTRKELEHVKKVLEHISNPDGNITKALVYIEKNIQIYKSQRGQLKDSYEKDNMPW